MLNSQRKFSETQAWIVTGVLTVVGFVAIVLFDNRNSTPQVQHDASVSSQSDDFRKPAETIQADYRLPEQASDPIGHRSPADQQWAEWMSDNNLEEKKRIYSRIPEAWAAADEEAGRKGLIARRERQIDTPADLRELNRVLRQIEEIEDRKFRELANHLGVSYDYLNAINAKGAIERW